MTETTVCSATKTHEEVEEALFQEPSSRSDVSFGKPPVVPCKATSKKTRSILKRSGSESSSKRCVSFVDSDDDFSEPTLRFWLFKDPRNSTAARKEEDHAVAPKESMLSVQSEDHGREREPNVMGATTTCQQPPVLLCEPHCGSPNIVSHDRPLCAADKNEEAASGAILLDASPKEMSLQVLSPEAAYHEEVASPFTDVTVSDKTPSSFGAPSERLRSVSSKAAATDSAVPGIPEVGITLVAFEASSQHLLLPTTSLSPFSVQGGSKMFQSADVSVPPPSSESSVWIGNAVNADVRPMHTQSAAVTNSGDDSCFLPHFERSDMLSFEGGVDPADLVFDDSFLDSPTATLEKEKSGDCGDSAFAAVSTIHSRRVTEFPVQLYPALITKEEVSSAKEFGIFQRLTPASSVENENLRRSPGSGTERCQLFAGDGDHLPAPLQPFPLCGNKLSVGLSKEKTWAKADVAVQTESPRACVLESQFVQHSTGDKPAEKCDKPLLSLGCTQFKKRTEPVVVNYVNKLSASWEETFSGDAQSCGNFHDAACSPPGQEDAERQLFSGDLFGQFLEDTWKHHVKCPATYALETPQVISITKAETVVSKPVMGEKKEKLVNITPVVVPVEKAIQKYNTSSKCHLTQQTETQEATSVQGETIAAGDEFEDVDSYSTHLERDLDFALPKAAAHLTPQQRRMHLWTESMNTVHTSEINLSSSGKGSLYRAQKGCNAEAPDEEERRRARRFEKLRFALFQIACGEKSPFARDNSATNCADYRLQERRGSRRTAAVDDIVRVQKRITLPPPPPSPVTAEGLIHTPERTASPGESEEALNARRLTFFAAGRSPSPVDPICDLGCKRSSLVLNGNPSTMLERRVNDRIAIRNFARDIAGIVSSVRESTLVRIL